jgi:hypothetical protein
MEEENLNEFGVDIDWWKRITLKARCLFVTVRCSIEAMGPEGFFAPGLQALTQQQLELVAHNAAFTAADSLSIAEADCEIEHAGMRSYLGAKIIDAKPMTLDEFSKIQQRPYDPKDDGDGYMVVYPDGYKSWSPKAVFEEAYRPVNAAEKGMVASGRA